MNENLVGKSVPKNYLLVEGNDDVNVCFHLLQRHRIKEEISIIDKKGIENILQTLDVEIIGSGPRRIGVVVDADEDILSRWQSLQDILIRAGYQTIPDQPDLNGTDHKGR